MMTEVVFLYSNTFTSSCYFSCFIYGQGHENGTGSNFEPATKPAFTRQSSRTISFRVSKCPFLYVNYFCTFFRDTYFQESTYSQIKHQSLHFLDSKASLYSHICLCQQHQTCFSFFIYCAVFKQLVRYLNKSTHTQLIQLLCTLLYVSDDKEEGGRQDAATEKVIFMHNTILSK